MRNKLVAWFLVLAMVFTMVPTMVFAEEEIMEESMVIADTEPVEIIQEEPSAIPEVIPEPEEIVATIAEDEDVPYYVATCVAEFDDYNVGDTVSVDIVVTSDDADTVSHFQFEPVYEEFLTLKGVTTTFEGGELQVGNSGIYVFTTTGDGYQEVGEDGVVIATMTFIIDEDTTATDAKIDLDNVAISGVDSPITSSGSADCDILIHNIKVTFEDGDNATVTGTPDLVAVVRYGEAGLYTDRTYSQSFIIPTVTLSPGFELVAGEEWVVGETTYTDADLKALELTESITVTPNAVGKITVTYAVEGEGTISEAGPVYGAEGDEIILPDVTPNENYEFDGWTVTTTDENGNLVVTTIEPDTDGDYIYTITDEDVTITATFKAQSFDVVVDATMVTVTDAEGTTVPDENDADAALAQATYNEPYTFTVAATSGAVTSVSYSVEGGSTGVILTPDSDGVYTIPGKQITDMVTITAVATEYLEITFKAGDGTTLEGSTTAYAVFNKVGLYADITDIPSGVPNFIVPTVIADSNYRIDETVVWSGISDFYSTGDLYVNAQFLVDQTLTATAIQQITIYFESDDETHGTVNTRSLTVDRSTTLTTDDYPGTTPAEGYVFASWDTPSIFADPAADGTTVTANFANASYTATFSGTIPTAGALADADVGGLCIIHGTAVSFEPFDTSTDEDGNPIYVDENGEEITSIHYRVGTGDSVTVSLDDLIDGEYTIPGEEITGNLSVWVSTVDSIDVLFVVEPGTGVLSTITQTQEVGSPSVDYNDHMGVSVAAAAEATASALAAAGYEFVYWSVGSVYMNSTDIGNMAITEEITFTAVFRVGEFDVTVEGEGVTGIPATATGLEDFEFEPEVEGGTITEVTVTYPDGTTETLTPDDDGKYKVPGEKVTGPITITVDYISGTLFFIYDSQYKALTADTKIAVLSGAAGAGSTIYTIEGVKMFYTEATSYGDGQGVYLLIVDFDVTVEQVLAVLSSTTEGELTTIAYSNDVNSDGNVNVTDAGRINAFLHDLAITGTDDEGENITTESQFTGMVSTSQQLERLMADVNETSNVSVLDIAPIISAIKG